MSYTIRWSRRALDAVAQLWLDNPELRAAITQAADSVDQLLQFNPQERGESRDDARRILFVPPLAVIFRVDAERNLVRVLVARLLKRRRTG